MPKKGIDKEETVDPTVKRVQATYEESLTFFMSNIAPMLERYNQLLQAALPQNPKAAYFSDESTEKSTAPTAVAEDTSAPAAAASFESGTATPPPEGSSPQKQPTSPLLARPKLDPVAMAELEKSAVVLLRQSSSVALQARSTPLTDGTAAKTPLITASATASKKKEKEKAPTTEQLDSLSLPPLLLVQLKIIKNEARALGKTLDQIHDWIALNIPQMKEEDNVGVAVMASVISEIAGGIAKVRGVYDMEAAYVSDRAELDVKYLKTTDAESTLQAIEVCDADAWDTLEKGWRTLIRVALLLHSTLAKNMKLLKDPRGAPKHSLHL